MTPRVTHLVLAAGAMMSAQTPLAAQTGDQGTITRQRPRLDSPGMAPATNGWLNDSTAPKFWAWELHSDVTDLTAKHPDMQVMVQHRMWASSLSSSSTINTLNLDQQAQVIANTIVSRLTSTGPDAISDGEYAICLLGLHSINLHDHPDDELDDAVDLFSNTTLNCQQWLDLPPAATDLSRASVWRSNSVAIADSAIEYLTDEIVARVQAAGHSFPAPLRIFFDEERNRTHGIDSMSNIGEHESMLTDARWSTESLHGNFDLWDATPASTHASEVFTSHPLADIDGWRTACNPFMPIIYGVGINAYDYTDLAHQNPSFDHEFYPINQLYNGVLAATIDGAFVPALDHPLNSTDWGGFKWSNYSTSGYYSHTYPTISKSDRGALNKNWGPHEGYGFAQVSKSGSAPIQSPVLYPPSDFWEEDISKEKNDTSLIESPAEAWLRSVRTQLDHAIFSMPEFDTLGLTAPRHFSPWVPRVGTLIWRPGPQGGGNDTSITTKDAVRDVIAVCRAKGVNEIIFWGNPDSEFFGERCDGLDHGDLGQTPAEGKAIMRQYNWDATNDAIAQVFDYNLNGIKLGPLWLAPGSFDGFRFSEENAYSVSGSLNPTSVEAVFEARFASLGLTEAAGSYSFVLETIDGGGPWDGAAYTLRILNQTTGLYEKITATPEELFSTSARRAEFTDTDSDGYSNEWERTFDDQAYLPTTSSVIDRKTILKWHIDLPIGGASLGDYVDSNRMQFEVKAAHTALPPAGKAADPLRVDLVQLYETECENDNISVGVTLNDGDLNRDGVVDATDLEAFLAGFRDGDTKGAHDANDDGAVDIRDLLIVVEAMRADAD